MKVNLIYFKDKSVNGNFGVELSKFITEKLICNQKYNLVFNTENVSINILCIGSYIHCAKNNSYIFGSGIRTPNNLENGHRYDKCEYISKNATNYMKQFLDINKEREIEKEVIRIYNKNIKII